MARCKNAELLHKLNVNQLKDWMEVTFSLVSDITNCVTINTRDELNGVGEYRMYDRPENQWDCNGGICTTTGTRYATSDMNFFKALDPTEYASGVITMYVKPSAGNEGGKVSVALSSNSSGDNVDIYEHTITLEEIGPDGYYPILIDLTKTPTATEGSGWTHEGNGVYVSVNYTVSDTDKEFGLSTIEFYKSMYDMATANIVKIACLSEVGGTFDVGALEETCLSSGYDETSLSGGIDQTITGKQLTSNYWMLNPLTGMNRYDFDDNTGDIGYRVETVKKTIEAQGDYGVVQLCDVYPEECSFIGAQIDDKCATPAADLLHRVLSPVTVSLQYDQFQFHVTNNTGYFVFNKALVGKDVLLTYPQAVYLKERMVGNNDNLGEVHVKMSYPRFLSDGTEEIHTFNNVLITSFPSSITNEETEFTFTVNIQRDSNGDWFTVQRVLSDYSPICQSEGGNVTPGN